MKKVDWFLYDNGLRHERVNQMNITKYEKRNNLIAGFLKIQLGIYKKCEALQHL